MTDMPSLHDSPAPDHPSAAANAKTTEDVAVETLTQVNPSDSVNTDLKFNRNDDLVSLDHFNIDSLKNRDTTYTEILDDYAEYARTILEANSARQEIFFWVSFMILVFSPIQFFCMLYNAKYDPSLAPLIASTIEFVGAMLIFPKIVAQYLFNTNDITNVNNIVTAIQSYDLETRKEIRQTAESSKPNS